MISKNIIAGKLTTQCWHNSLGYFCFVPAKAVISSVLINIFEYSLIYAMYYLRTNAITLVETGDCHIHLITFSGPKDFSSNKRCAFTHQRIGFILTKYFYSA